MKTVSQHPLIGELKVPSPQSKTKDNVDLAGHSQPQVLWKDSTSSKMETYLVSLNNRSAIAPLHMETRDVKVV